MQILLFYFFTLHYRCIQYIPDLLEDVYQVFPSLMKLVSSPESEKFWKFQSLDIIKSGFCGTKSHVGRIIQQRITIRIIANICLIKCCNSSGTVKLCFNIIKPRNVYSPAWFALYLTLNILPNEIGNISLPVSHGRDIAALWSLSCLILSFFSQFF